MLKFFSICACVTLLVAPLCLAQEPAPPAKPTEHVLGTVTAVDQNAHSITVKDDKSGTESTVLLGDTKTLLKVPPGAKDLKSATRITADDLQTGDRVDVRGSKPDNTAGSMPPNAIVARSVVLMSARDLAQAHQQEAAAWQHSTAGTVNSVDPAAQKLEITVRTPGGPLPMTVNISKSTGFTRYSADTPKTPAPSQLTDIQPGDQVRIIGDRSDDGAFIAAQKIYSGAFRTVAGTVTSIAADNKQLTIKDLQTKHPVEVTLTSDSVIRKLPPMMAMGLARRLNPDFKAAQASAGPENRGNAGGAPPYGAKAGEAAGTQGAGTQGAPMHARSGDVSSMIEHAPAIAISDLKTGDAVVVSGVVQGADKSHLVASSVIAGVEPIFQSAPAQQSRSLGDWSLDMQVPAQQ